MAAKQVADSTGTTINPATDEMLDALYEQNAYLRQMVSLLEPLAVQDSSNRQRVVADGCVISSGTITTLSTLTTVTNAVPVGNIATIASVDPRFQFIDLSDIAYAETIRNKLVFS